MSKVYTAIVIDLCTGNRYDVPSAANADELCVNALLKVAVCAVLVLT